MMCVRMPNMWFTAAKLPGTVKRTVERMSDTELRHKICENKRGQRGDCRNCEIRDMCRIGQEVLKRGLKW
jgi:radical SAM protein with 4Fe4S-binding SPASM domain